MGVQFSSAADSLAKRRSRERVLQRQKQSYMSSRRLVVRKSHPIRCGKQRERSFGKPAKRAADFDERAPATVSQGGGHGNHIKSPEGTKLSRESTGV